MIDALLLIQDVQLLCYTVIFGFVAWQHWKDPTRRWLWYSFLANAAGALMDFGDQFLPAWVGRGVDLCMIPLSYALLNTAIVYFLRRYRWTQWISVAILAGIFPVLQLWSGRAEHYPGDALVDLAIGLQCAVTAVVLLGSRERATRASRLTMSWFFFPFAAIELTRAFVAFGLKQDPDVFSHKLEMVSAVAYVVSTSVLPLAFVWMMNSRLEAELIEQNLMDPLTQVLNRRGLRRALDLEMAQHLRSATPFTFAIMDLDHFKRLNDTHGHATGDAMLFGVATLLKEQIRATDTVARMGGEEFVMLMPGTSEAEAATLLEQLRSKLAAHIEQFEGKAVSVTASFGATTTPAETEIDVKQLLREADVALYRAKQDGRDRVCFFVESEEDEAVPQRVYLG